MLPEIAPRRIPTTSRPAPLGRQNLSGGERAATAAAQGAAIPSLRIGGEVALTANTKRRAANRAPNHRTLLG